MLLRQGLPSATFVIPLTLFRYDMLFSLCSLSLEIAEAVGRGRSGMMDVVISTVHNEFRLCLVC